MNSVRNLIAINFWLRSAISVERMTKSAKKEKTHFEEDHRGVVVITEDHGTMADTIPASFLDVYNHANLLMKVASACVGAPDCTTLPRLLLLTTEMTKMTARAGFMAFNPCTRMSLPDRLSVISNMDKQDTELFDDLLIYHVADTTDHLWNLAATGETIMHLKDEVFISHGLNGQKIATTLRSLTTVAVANERDRSQLLRLKASSSPLLPIRTMLMLADPMFPLTIVPGVSGLDHLYLHCLETDKYTSTFLS